MDSVSAVRPERIDGDAVAELFERDGQRGRRPSLVVVYGEAVRIGIGGGPGGVEQDEHAEIAGEFAAFQVDVFRWRVAGAQIDEQIDERLDVEFVAIGTAAQNLGAEADARQASPEHVVVRHAGGGDVGGGGQRKIDDPAPVGPIAVVEDVPLRMQGAADADRSAGLAVIGELDPGGKRPGIRPDRVRPPDGADLSSLRRRRRRPCDRELPNILRR